jgi:hypothetical protein
MPGYYTIQGLRALSTNNSILSSSPDGTDVDLWNVDDLSGRQQWQFAQVVGLPPGVYNIIIKGGVSGSRTFLSSSPDGTNVDLWTEDDRSGRQRWTLKPVRQPGSDLPMPSYYNIQVLGGTVPQRTQLSCSADGKSVDLWTDDNSGRQRWQVQGVPLP